MTALSHWSCEGSRAAILTRSGPTRVCVLPSRAANPPPPPDKNRPKRIYAWEREVSAVKATQLNTACNKKGWFQVTAAIRTATQQLAKRSQRAQTWALQACELFLLQRGWEGFCLEMWIVVLRCVTLVWAQVHGKMRRNAEGQKAISKMKAGGRGRGIVTLKVTDYEQERRHHRPAGWTGQGESRSRQPGGSH